MTKSELIKLLEPLNDNALIVLSSDEEGNRFMELKWIELGFNYKDGEIGFPKITLELREEGYDEEDILDGTPCIILYP